MYIITNIFTHEIEVMNRETGRMYYVPTANMPKRKYNLGDTFNVH